MPPCAAATTKDREGAHFRYRFLVLVKKTLLLVPEPSAMAGHKFIALNVAAMLLLTGQ
jgi:hypothetical protein